MMQDREPAAPLGRRPEAAPGLKRIKDATRIRRRILIAFERAELATDAAERQRLLTFAIVVGGPTGVEMAGAISEAQVAISICDRLADGESLLAEADMYP
jgi:NADH dehydrogenase FAD-containing subunit